MPASAPLVKPMEDVCQDPVSRYLRRRFSQQTFSTYLFVTLAFGIVTGVIAAFYNFSFQLALQLIWEIRGEEPCGWFERWLMDLDSFRSAVGRPFLKALADGMNTSLHRVGFLYILFMSTIFGTLAGVVQKYLGFPGDLPDTVKHVHRMETVPIKQVHSMFFCSIFTIVSGGSLGPEAPLLAMCASTTGWISKNILGHQGQLLRDCTLIGMAAGLAAFFGVGLGGALFAFEVLHRTGLQFFEALTFGVSTGMICLTVFRGILGLHFGPIWEFEEGFEHSELKHIFTGVIIGIVSAIVAIFFIKLHKLINKILLYFGLQEHKTPVKSGFVGGVLIGLIGIFLPPTMFWSEFEISNMANTAHPLTHVWPENGLWGTGPFHGGDYEGWIFLLIGIFKLAAISITVLSGLRGGFIFPLMFAGAAFGRAVLSIPHFPVISDQPIVLLTMGASAGLNASITRTPFASSLILTTLSGHLEVLPSILCSALVAFFITMPFDFIKPQQYRADIISIATPAPSVPARLIWSQSMPSPASRMDSVSEIESKRASVLADEVTNHDGMENQLTTALLPADGGPSAIVDVV